LPARQLHDGPSRSIADDRPALVWSHAIVRTEGCAMAATPDVRPVGDLPNEIGRTAARELSLNGISSLEQVARHSREQLLAIHGVGPKAVRILDAALATKDLGFKDSSAGSSSGGTREP
jgi:hypothetical protein